MNEWFKGKRKENTPFTKVLSELTWFQGFYTIPFLSGKLINCMATLKPAAPICIPRFIGSRWTFSHFWHTGLSRSVKNKQTNKQANKQTNKNSSTSTKDPHSLLWKAKQFLWFKRAIVSEQM